MGVGLLATLIPASPASAATVVVFSAGAEVCFDTNNNGVWCEEDDGGNDIDQPADLFFPAGPCGGGLCPAPAGVKYEFTTSLPGVSIPGANIPVGCRAISNGATDLGCQLSSNGEVNPGLAGVGPYCGYSSGQGTTSSVVAGQNLSGYVKWTQSAGTVIPTEVYSDAAMTDLVGVGATQSTGAAPGSCGVGGPTNRFLTTGFVALTTP